MTTVHSIPPALPHGPLTEVFPNIFVVRGQFRLGPGVAIARSMTVVRRGEDLTLINSVRLSEVGEAELARLGTVRNVVRLGAGHGADDAYMVQRYAPRFFAPARMEHRDGVVVDALLVDGERLDFGARAFVFRGGDVDEACLLLDDAEGILISCDALQNWTSREGCSFLGGLIAVAMGFMEPAKIGPFWLKAVTRNQPDRLQADFERLLALPFKHLLPGHGSPLLNEAKERAAASVRRTFSGARRGT